MKSAEVLIFGNERPMGDAALRAAANGAYVAGMAVSVTNQYAGSSDWLCMYAASQVKHRPARFAHIGKGRPVACIDHAYVGRGSDPETSHMRISIDHMHPRPSDIRNTEPNPCRWERHGIATREDFEPGGHVIVAGIGGSARMRNGDNKWERETIAKMRARFPGRKITFRPKPGLGITENFGADVCENGPLEELMKGASLLVCTHSNIAIDACIAGIPVECTDGVALYLYQKQSRPSLNQRLDFLYRMAWWQWKLNEMDQAWKFLNRIR